MASGRTAAGDAAYAADPNAKCCGWCYGAGAASKCAKCPRLYCSRACQVEDWRRGGHKTWCGRAGQKRVDYEVRGAAGKGLGLFAKRVFVRGEKILVERPVVTLGRRELGARSLEDVVRNEHTRKAILALHPFGENWLAKFSLNCAALEEDASCDSGLFIDFSRVNHDCVGNSHHIYDDTTGVMLLIASHDISAGSEITFSYAMHLKSAERRLQLLVRGFQCFCKACQTPDIAEKLDRCVELDEKMGDYVKKGRARHAILTGKLLISIYDALQLSDALYARTYYEMYQVAILRYATQGVGIGFIRKAQEHAILLFGPQHEKSRFYQQYIDNAQPTVLRQGVHVK